jgi:hypothetical protein
MGVPYSKHEQAVQHKISELLDLTKTKANAYGGDDDIFQNLNDFGWQGVIIRLDDKMNRLKNLVFAKREIDPNDESLQDTLNDLINYALIVNTLMQAGGKPRYELKT